MEFDYDKEGLNKPMKIIDAASMLRRKLEENERPFMLVVLKNNNKLVDEWYEEVLKKTCNRDLTIKAGQVHGEWEYFYNGKIIKNFIDNINDGYIIRPDEKAVKHWVYVFTHYTMEKLIELGSNCVGYGWKLISDELYIKRTLERWEKIYSKSDDPLEWRKLANNYPKLWNLDGENPYWDRETLDNITQKVMTILKTPIQPI